MGKCEHDPQQWKISKGKTWNMKCTLGFYGDFFEIVIRMMFLASWEDDRLHQTDFMRILGGLVPTLVYLPFISCGHY